MWAWHRFVVWNNITLPYFAHIYFIQLFNSIACNGYRFLYIATKPDASQKVSCKYNIYRHQITNNFPQRTNY